MPSGEDFITLDNGAKFQKSECWFPLPNKHVECGWFYTAPVAGSKQSDFQLPVVIFRYKGSNKKDDPIVYLAGGPGASAWLTPELIQTFWENQWEEHLSKLNRDLVLFDQRGSGLSLPKIECPYYKEHAAHLLLDPNEPEDDAKRYHEVAVKCVADLKKSGIAINQLATRFSANDVVDIMQALGYEHWNIQSVSYGTRLGIEVQRRFPDKVRTLMLDSVYPPSAHLFEDWPMLLNSSLERIFKFCEIDSACAASADQFQERFWKLMAKLRKSPLRIDINNPKAGIDHIMLNDVSLLAVLFQSEYRTNILPYLTEAIFELENNNTQGIQAFVEDYVSNQFDSLSNDAVYWAVECHDNPAIDKEKYENYKRMHPRLTYYLAEDSNVCEVWNQGYQYIPLMPAVGNKKEQAKHTPVLIFSGEDDPITPSDWAIDSAASFGNNAYLFSFYGVSHSVLDNKACAPELYNGFVNNPQKRPRANCRIDNEISPMKNDTAIALDEPEEEFDEDNGENDVEIATVNTADPSEKRLPN